MSARKLIEAALPLDAINAACKAEKDRKTGTIRNLHKWFAPMPLPAWRALLFAALVDDPDDEADRERLMRLVERLVENGGDLPAPEVLSEARREIEACWPSGPPPVMDPFCGGGSTLVEAQRLGCATVASDLNPVPALITKTLTELLPRVAGLPTLHTDAGKLAMSSHPYDGVTEDIRYYSEIVGKRARDSVAALYPHGSADGEVVAWMWCRTVACPNPACGIEAPLTTSWMLSKRRGDERWIMPTVDGGRVSFTVEGPTGDAPAPVKSGRGANFVCVACDGTLHEDHVAAEGIAGRLGLRMTAVVEIDSNGVRSYRAARQDEESAALAVKAPDGIPVAPMPANPRWFSPPLYGFTQQSDLYTGRQLHVLAAVADAVSGIDADVESDGGDIARAEAVVATLALCVGKLAQANSTQVRWKLDSRSGVGTVQGAFGDQSIPMTWDFAETNPFGSSAGGWDQVVTTALRALPYAPTEGGTVSQGDARRISSETPALIATDPPYFDQIGYADLSDFFYIWLRRALQRHFPELCATMVTPKTDELVALPSRHGGSRADAKRYFIEGFTETFQHLKSQQAVDCPMLVVYAFKEQATTAGKGEVAPGWEAILEALLAADLTIVGTWPIHGTGSTRKIGQGTNALASYVVLVCRPRAVDATRITRSDLARQLRSELAASVSGLQKANIAPVDLAQAVIGPGMEIYSRHSHVVETDGSRLGVASALALINRTLAEALDEQEGDLDPDSRWAATWYDQHGFGGGSFGEADQLARAKGIAVDDLVRAGIVTSRANKVQLISREDMPDGWDPVTDRRATAWEGVQHLVRTMELGGETAAAGLYGRLGALAESTRELAYRLFQLAEKSGRVDEAIAYNGIVASWSEMARLSAATPQNASALPDEALF